MLRYERGVRALRVRFLVVSILPFAVLAAACAGVSGKQKSRGLTRIVETGELRVGMSGEQPPLNMTTRSGELIGMEVALARVLGQSMGVETRFVRLPFGELLDALQKGQVDLVMSGVTITPKRSTRVTFVGPYYTSGKSLLTRSESLANVQLAKDLDAPGLRLAALDNSTSEEFVHRSLPQAKLTTTATLEQAIQLVMNGKVDALVADRETCSFAVLRHPDAGLIASSAAFTVEPMGIAVPQDQPALANLVQTYLTALVNRGVLERVRKFWFQDDSWVKELR